MFFFLFFFCCHSTKGGTFFYNFLFVFLDDETVPERALNPIVLRMAKTPQSFGQSECNSVKGKSFGLFLKEIVFAPREANYSS